MKQSTNRGVQKVLVKLEKSIKDKNFYEAHQMYRTLYFRYLEQKRYDDLIQMLFNGSLLFLQHEQHTSGADLGLLLIDVLKKSKTGASEDYFDKLIELFKLLESGSPERDTFAQNAIKWSAQDSNYLMGHPQLHRRIAHVYWNEKNFSAARLHFLHANDDLNCANMLIELHSQHGYSNEVELFITQIVLQFLCLHNVTSATNVFEIYIKKHSNAKKEPPFSYPLFNFLYFLLKAVKLGKEPFFRFLFTFLCQKYIPSLNRDPSFAQYLDKIGHLYLDIEPPTPTNGKIFSSFLNSLFNIDDSDDYELD